MKKKPLFLILALCGMMTASAQTLFTYGNHKVDAKDFMKAYNKNNDKPVADKAKSIKNYLGLFIKSKLKVQEAYSRGIDTLPSLVSEVSNLRSQIVENYMTDPQLLDRMTKEAFSRSRKDIQVAHIFISFKNTAGAVDTIAAQKKLNEVLQHLKKGENFQTIAQKFSDDPEVKTNKGNLGYITVFTLPYPFETAIYNTAVGKYSAVVRSHIGYHIFKNLKERKAAGKIKTQQILLAIPPGTDEKGEKEIAARADSIYKRLLAGDSFSQLAGTFSNDYVSAATGGNIPDVGVGQYDPSFESILFSLPKDGAFSKPFLTTHGWHIVKRVSVKPVITDPNNQDNLKDLEQKIMADGRWKNSSDFIYNTVMKVAGYQEHPFTQEALWAYTDSLLNRQPMRAIGHTINGTTPLLSIGAVTYDVNAWVNYARTNRFKQDGTGTKPYPEVWTEWTRFAMKNYYRDNLEQFNEDFRKQMAEFKEGNMFFEIMQTEVWNKAQADSSALLELYTKNKQKYTWSKSADAVIFFCSDQGIAKTVYNEVKGNPANWRIIIEKYSEKVIGDSSRYEWSQLPNLNKMLPINGMLTSPLINKTDNTASFAYIVKTYPNPTQRSFNEARGLVISDYQEFLEKQWDEKLEKKYPVKIDEKVLKSILK